ncbi:MAG: hypothetical protein ACKN9E_09765 [Microcystaceae cyanobacterium]
MSYSDFSLESVHKRFGLTLTERVRLFSQVSDRPASHWLQETLAYNLPLALAINSEKARSELIIAPILVELKKQLSPDISLFSGVEFNVELSLGLNGICDFLLSASPEQLWVTSPICVIVEAKKENLNGGLGQCIAEMFAAKLFNERQENPIAQIYGAVTTGNLWKFLRLEAQTVSIDLEEYAVNQVNHILGILSTAFEQL